jgi:hypothetical protein
MYTGLPSNDIGDADCHCIVWFDDASCDDSCAGQTDVFHVVQVGPLGDVEAIPITKLAIPYEYDNFYE